MSGKGLLLTWGTAEPPAPLRDPAVAAWLDGIDVYEFPSIDLQRYRAIFVGMHVDQRFVAAQRPLLEAFLAKGGTLVITGHIAYPILPELQSFVPLPKPGRMDLEVVRVGDHPIFEGVDPAEQTAVKGVAGFYGRGHNPPPAGARILNRLGSGEGVPVDFVYRRGAGVVFVHAGNDYWQYMNDGRTTARLVPQLLVWAVESSARRGAS